MADFSQEYQTATRNPSPGDFVILEEFEGLPDRATLPLICEGFGNHSIKNVAGHCYLVFFHREPLLLDEAIRLLTDINR